MGNLDGKYAVAGVGIARPGDRPGESLLAFTLHAAVAALEDAGLEREDIDGLFITGPAAPRESSGWSARVAAGLGIAPGYHTSLDPNGPGACSAVQFAIAAIEAGYCTAVLCCFGARKPRPGDLPFPRSEFGSPYGDLGGLCRLGHLKRRQQADFGLRDEHYGRIALTWRENARRNPRAERREPLEMDGYLSSPWIVEPLREADCCPPANGGGACIVTSFERASDLSCRGVRILGVGHAVEEELLPLQGRARSPQPLGRAAERMYRMAGVSAGDVDVAQFDDLATPCVVRDLSAFGFCAPEGVGSFIERGELSAAGALPSNTGGGQLCEGVFGGFGLLREAMLQLRGTAGERQVADPEIGLVTGYGEPAPDGLGAVSVAGLLLSR